MNLLDVRERLFDERVEINHRGDSPNRRLRGAIRETPSRSRIALDFDYDH